MARSPKAGSQIGFMAGQIAAPDDFDTMFEGEIRALFEGEEDLLLREIHRLGPDDLAAMRRLNALFAEVFADPASYAGAPPSDAHLVDTLSKPHVLALVATEGAATIGGLVAYEMEKLEQARREIYIYDLAVPESHRRRGVATALIGHLCGIARERGAWAVFVQADHGDAPAVALYTKLGTREDVMHFDIDIDVGTGGPPTRRS